MHFRVVAGARIGHPRRASAAAGGTRNEAFQPEIVLLADVPIGLLKVARDRNTWALIQIQILPEKQRGRNQRSAVSG
jgi:hypothetical protein